MQVAAKLEEMIMVLKKQTGPISIMDFEIPFKFSIPGEEGKGTPKKEGPQEGKKQFSKAEKIAVSQVTLARILGR